MGGVNSLQHLRVGVGAEQLDIEVVQDLLYSSLAGTPSIEPP